MARGPLIVFEGAEGVGKSTQLRRVASWLESGGRVVHALREPGGTPLGDEIRRLLLDPASDITPRAEALLFMASRAQLVETLVRPALAAGHVVLLDRFFLSTYAYQGAGRGLPEAEVRQANAVATGGLVPDITLLMTLPVREGLARAERRGARDRMERNADEFHHRVSAAFAAFAAPAWQAAHPECGPIVTVDASGPEAEVFARITNVISARLGLS
ncbi:MAG TPA: dTMP kinase [Gemmatimonadaceae bacterium]|nr:dTMP kinase [Gemmatimonadaceae bacterium]